MGNATVAEDGHQHGEAPPQYHKSSQRPSTPWLASELLLRVMVIGFSLAALILMAKNKQVVFQYIAGVPIRIQAKHSYIKAFVYLVYANGIAAIYCFLVALLVLFTLILRAGSNRALNLCIFLLDQAITYVLLAAGAASTEVAYLGWNGNSKVGWNKVCDSFHHFCVRGRASLATTLVAIVLLIILCLMSGRKL